MAGYRTSRIHLLMLERILEVGLYSLAWAMGIGGFITFFQVSENIKETVNSQYEEMNLGDSWINLQPIPVPTPEELIEYSKQNEGEKINCP